MSARLRITVLEGDQTGQELLEASLRVLDPGLIGVPLELGHAARPRSSPRLSRGCAIDSGHDSTPPGPEDRASHLAARPFPLQIVAFATD